MTTPSEMDPTEVKRVQLQVLISRHRDLDAAIVALEATGTADAFTIRRLKKQKLALKDRIAAIEDDLTPDIIA
ncbi:YdcH family protein [Tropicimonas sp.]|uniref:YdcH family protein n=1 Tax=Tropicimonas sp. TaxID=2067044 RepID=UPI003A87C2E4